MTRCGDEGLPQPTPALYTAPTMRRLPIRSALLAALLVTSIAALGPACTVEGTTADCSNNVTADGVASAEDGCQQFAVCPSGGPVNCCQDPDLGLDPESCEYQFCLFGYGAARTEAMLRCLDPAGTIGAGGGGTGGGGGDGG